MKRVTAEQEYEKNKGVLKKEDVQTIQEWIKTQPHLPEISEFEVILFLNSNYYEVEATKKTIENYYTMRTNYTEFFTARDTTLEALKEAMEVVLLALLPARTKEGHLIMMMKLMDPNPKRFDFLNNAKVHMMMMDIILLEEGTHSGVVFICDMEGLSWSHMLKTNLSLQRKQMNYVQEALPVRIKSVVHFNLPSFIDKMLYLCKPFMKESLLNMLKFSQTIEGTYDVIPPECYPSDYSGGTAPSLAEYHINFKKKLLQYTEHFKEEELKRRVDESKRVKQKSFWNIF